MDKRPIAAGGNAAESHAAEPVAGGLIGIEDI